MEHYDLHLPRILCLHGGGTNARIFRAQCRVLHSHLNGIFRLIFAQGPFPSPPGPDVESVYKDWGPFRGWVPHPSFQSSTRKTFRSTGQQGHQETDESLSRSVEVIERTMEEDDELGAYGPWVAVLGFSQGAKMAASLLLLHQLLNARSPFTFHFGILLAGRAPLLQLHHALPVSPNVKLRTRTIHVHGLLDDNIDLHRQLLYECCERGSAELVEWQGGHRVMVKSKDVRAVVARVLAMAQEAGVRLTMGVETYLAGERGVESGYVRLSR